MHLVVALCTWFHRGIVTLVLTYHGDDSFCQGVSRSTGVCWTRELLDTST